MALEDIDLIDQAMDAAEASMQDASSSAVEQEDPVAAENPQDEPLQSKSVSRDERGKFTKAQKVEQPASEDLDQEADDEVVETEQELDIEPVSSIEPPAFWSVERKALFSKAQPELQRAIVEAENVRNEFVNRKVAEADRAIQIEKRANEVFAPYKLKLQANGLKDPLEAAERLLAWNEIFEQDVITGITDLMRKNGITPYDLLQETQENAEQYSSDPRVEEALRAAQEARELAVQQRQYIEQQTKQAGLAQIEAFKRAQDETGQPRGQYFEFYKPQIINAMQEILATRPEMPEIDALTHAYDFVIGEVRKVFGNTKPTGLQKQSAGNPQKAKIAASSVTGAPANGAPQAKAKARTIEEAMDLAEEEIASRRQ